MRLKLLWLVGISMSIHAAGIAARPGDWPQWRRDPQHSGWQPLAGRIENPSVRWKYRLGGDPNDTLLCSSGVDTLTFLSAGGSITSVSLEGHVRWSVPDQNRSTLLGCADFFGDGGLEIVTASRGISNSSLAMLDVATGETIWTSPISTGAIGSVKAVNVDGEPGDELFWAPAAVSDMFAFTRANDGKKVRTYWSANISNYISDPYTYSPIIIGDFDHSGTPEVAIGGGRAQVPIIVLNARNGREIRRAKFNIDPSGGHAFESGGTLQYFAAFDVPGRNSSQFLIVSNYDSSSQFMFQGAISAPAAALNAARIRDTNPRGLKYTSGSLTDIDGDGIPELIVSRWNDVQKVHSVEVLDALTLQLRASNPNFSLVAVIPGSPVKVLGFVGNRAENIPTKNTLVAAQLGSNGVLDFPLWFRDNASVPLVERQDLNRATASNLAAKPMLVGDPNDPSVVVSINGELQLTRVSTGVVVARLNDPLDLRVLDGTMRGVKPTILIRTDGGRVGLLDDQFQLRGSLEIGGYYRNRAANGHTSELAAVGDIDGDGSPDISVIDSLNRNVIVKSVLSTRRRSSMSSLLRWTRALQEPLILPRRGILVKSDDAAALELVDGDGESKWSFGSAIADGAAVGVTIGSPDSSQCSAAIFSSANANAYPRPTNAIDLCTGATLWRSPIGTYWDATFALGDVTGDGREDVVFNYNTSKGFVLDSRNGALLSDYGMLPMYGDLGFVDYNGSPVLVDADGDGRYEILNAGDDAHLALLKPGYDADSDRVRSQMVWAVPQARIDDERYSMPAIAPQFDGKKIIGIGSQRGVFEARDARDGSLMWKKTLTSAVNDHVELGNVAAADVNGDGDPDFVVGGSDGNLYAFRARDGNLTWRIDLGGPVGDPIIADIDGDNFSEILVPVADGYLYAIAPRR